MSVESSPAQTTPRRTAEPGDVLAAISTEMVRIYKDKYGRGPTRTRTSWAGRDALICILEDTLTSAETTLREMGEYDRVRDLRTFIQYAGADEFVAAVERISGRRVRAFVSGVDGKSGAATEAFLLHPD